ncbi:hypothetical protein F5Y05DRAFT_419428 [Hypoxylon sp. FL0543]|nr:hypothetical protein F5Y05DRAFT_419428 [Hypoxylon sp. FL0543]
MASLHQARAIDPPPEVSITQFAPELIGNIVSYLDLPDAASLRLTCRDLSAKVSKGSGEFTKIFHRKTITLKRDTLEKFVKVTTTPSLACLLRHCVIAGFLPRRRSDRRKKSTEEHHEEQRLLTQAFRNLKEHGVLRQLLTLRLELRPEETNPDQQDIFRSWQAVWHEAQRAFVMTWAALHESQLSVKDRFDVFYGFGCCSLSTDSFSILSRELPGTNVFESVKALTLRLSAPAKSPLNLLLSDGDYNGSPFPSVGYLNQVWHSENALRSLLQCLSSLPHLEVLALHWFDLGRFTTTKGPGTQELPTSPLQVLSNQARALPFQDSSSLHLRKCSLQGIFVSESLLLEFLRHVGPAELHLSRIYLVSGTYQSIFAYMTNVHSPIKKFRIENVFQGYDAIRRLLADDPSFCFSRLVRIEDPSLPEWVDMVGIIRRRSFGDISREGDKAKEAIVYSVRLKLRINVIESSTFGPLDPGSFDLIRLIKDEKWWRKQKQPDPDYD